jgi:hypothetical protein
MKKNIARNDRMTMGNGGVDPRSAHRFEWIGLGAFVGLLSALAIQPVQAQPAIEAPTPAPSAVASQTAAAPERRIDHPADIAALTRFLTDFSPRKAELERLSFTAGWAVSSADIGSRNWWGCRRFG